MLKKTQLSVNINKIATLRNARGKNIPDLCYFAKLILESRALGLTVHPRPDERHILYKDIFEIKKLIQKYPSKELNIEGFPSVKFIHLIKKIKPNQCTLVPDPPHVLTSNAGWNFYKNKALLKRLSKELKQKNIRVSLFLDPLKMNQKEYKALKEIAPDRIELYTEAYAEKHNTKKQKAILTQYKNTAQSLHKTGIEINAGHDLNEDNLFDLLKAIPQIKEVSIGQALIAQSLERGLLTVIRSYLSLINKAFKN